VAAHGFRQTIALEAEPARWGGSMLVWRVLDVTLAAVLLLVLVPVLLLLAIVIKLDSPGPAIFRQRRLGRDMRSFTLRKFRTMRNDAESTPHREYIGLLIKGDIGANGSLCKLVQDDRVTRVGGFLRRWSLDELPQLWNVLRGEMSLVGPRPAISYELEHYEPSWLRRFSVKPGVTGLWQVSGRSRLTFREMVALDLQYVQDQSLRLNLRILLKTLRAVMDGKGAA
jgi:lipopolysaccharide/colanic/teichoic acid biosynthesis glycosyltransferase